MAQALLGGRLGGARSPTWIRDNRDRRPTVTDREDQLAEQLPEDLDPHEMADSVEDELVAEEGVELGLDPDLALFAARDELEEGEELPG
jgi:hypothetical protein